MVKNALGVHSVKKQESVLPTHFGQALLNFSDMTPEYESVGGLWWTAKSIWNQTLFTHEGVLLSGRLISTNIIQFVATIFILMSGISITTKAATTFDTYAAKVEAVEAFLDRFGVVDVNPDSFRIFLPTERSTIVVPMAVAVTFAFLAALCISIIVIPSASLITLKFRSGVLRFAQDPKVKLLRIAPDQGSSGKFAADFLICMLTLSYSTLPCSGLPAWFDVLGHAICIDSSWGCVGVYCLSLHVAGHCCGCSRACCISHRYFTSLPRLSRKMNSLNLLYFLLVSSIIQELWL
jgi:hypothetical protein